MQIVSLTSGKCKSVDGYPERWRVEGVGSRVGVFVPSSEHLAWLAAVADDDTFGGKPLDFLHIFGTLELCMEGCPIEREHYVRNLHDPCMDEPEWTLANVISK